SVPPGCAGTLHYHVIASDVSNPIAAFEGVIENLSIGGVQSLTLMRPGFGIFEGHADIGGVESPGSARLIEDVGEYEVEGGGGGFGGVSDEFYFLFRQTSSPFIFEGHVELDAYESDSDDVKAGLMVRDQLTSDSAFAWIQIQTDYWHDAQWRSTQGAAARSAGANDDNFGDFVIEKIGGVIRLYYYSAETGEKTLCRSLSLPMTDPVYVGVAVTASQHGALSKGFFNDLNFEEYDGWAERDLARESLPEGGGAVAANKVTVHAAAGKTSSEMLVEQAPEGFVVQNVHVGNGAASIDGNTIEWTLDHLSGTAVMTYDLIVPEEAGDAIAEFEGSFAGLPIAGDKAMHPIVFSIPFIDFSTVLDGVLGEGEYEGAYTDIFDHADRTPPGVHWTPEGGETPRDQENAAFYIFHNNNFIFAAVDVVDHMGLDFESGAEIWENDSIELYLDGNLSRSNPKEGGPYGFQATVLGGGGASAGDDPPAMIPLPYGGGASTDGLYWNAAARAKENLDGYIVEYAIDKNAVLDPPGRTVIGFDILVNSAENTGYRTGKWGYWNTSLGAAETDKEYWDDEQGWAIVELEDPRTTRLTDWPLY
ncbi:MAG: sugar-binding protein, partial [Candidatus Hinthialibacter sp.]